jgi:dCMP deaminase
VSDGISDSYRSGWRYNPAITELPTFNGNRPSWDSTWAEFAKIISQRSCDTKHKVGAVIVTDDNTQVLAIGYNGDEKGGSNKRFSSKKGESGFIHAELNALLKCDFNFPKDKKMYVTLSPCIMCAKAIINSGIKEVIYTEKYDDEGISFLKNYGIKVTKHIKR